MRSEKTVEYQLSLFVSDEVPWQSLPEEVRDQLVELLADLFKEEVKSEKPVLEEEAKDA